MADTLKDSPTLKIIACLLGALVLLTRFSACQQQAEMNNYYSDQMQQGQMQQQNQNQLQQQQMQQMMNEMNGGYGPRSSEPRRTEPEQ